MGATSFHEKYNNKELLYCINSTGTPTAAKDILLFRVYDQDGELSIEAKMTVGDYMRGVRVADNTMGSMQYRLDMADILRCNNILGQVVHFPAARIGRLDATMQQFKRAVKKMSAVSSGRLLDKVAKTIDIYKMDMVTLCTWYDCKYDKLEAALAADLSLAV